MSPIIILSATITGALSVHTYLNWQLYSRQAFGWKLVGPFIAIVNVELTPSSDSTL